MTDIRRRAFFQTTAAGLAGTLACRAHAAGSVDVGEGISEVRQQAMAMQRVDTHCHLKVTPPDLKESVQDLGDFSKSPGMAFSRQLALGCKKLYGVDTGLFVRPDSPDELFEKAAALHAQGPTVALETALDAANITIQFCFSGHDPDRARQTKYSSRLRVLAYIDDAIAGDDKAFCPDGREMDFNYYDSIKGHFGDLESLQDFLGALDAAIDNWRQQNVVGMKTAFAYTLGLDFCDPTLDEAKAAFAKKRDMNEQEIRTVQHYAFRHTLLACQRNELPVVVHTGFQIWGHSDLQQSNPILLHNLLVDRRYKDIVWVLLHGGNPYVGETTYLARMFPHVYIDFTWISWFTRARFRMALAEWLEIVPHGKICFGSDSYSPETIVGSDEITREEIANVLEDQIARRVIDDRVALDFLEHLYVKTPTRIFQL